MLARSPSPRPAPSPLLLAALLPLLLFAASCSEGSASADSKREIRPDLARHFTDAGFPGAFVLLDVNADHMLLVNPEVCETRYLPASTFKIANALIALESGVADGPGFALPWDGVTRRIEAWNHDHTLASAFSASALWYFQELARRIGPARYRDDLAAFDYGVGAERIAAVDAFWIDDSLKISPIEQVRFLQALHRGKLPVQAQNRAAVLDMMVLPHDGDEQVVLRAKTGWGVLPERPDVGWFVGFVEKGERVHAFATILFRGGPDDARTEELFRRSRRAVTEKILRELQLM